METDRFRENRIFDPKDLDDISYVKRLMEYESLIPGFSKEFAADPQGMLDKIGIPMTPRDVSFNPHTVENGNVRMNPKFPDTPAAKYAEFMNSKFAHRDEIKKYCTPANPSMKKWRERQICRCAIELGAKFQSLIHAPFAIELSDGCSVGCPFCGLAAGKLKSVFFHTPENAELFNGVIRAAREIIGDAVSEGTLYFGTEPLDNPDYELFMKDFTELFGNIPQITTARSTMYIERLRPLIADINSNQKNIYRFSILSEKMAREIFEAFTPQELILTELLPQYDEAPSCALVNAGKNGKDDDYGDTISCITGFVVNMARKDIKLATPIWASKEHPTGELILERAEFTDAEDFKEKIQGMISRHMNNLIAPDDRITLEEGISLELMEDKVVINTDKYVSVNLEAKGDMSIFKKVYDALSKGYRYKRDIVSELCVLGDGKIVPPEIVYYVINKWWGMGLIKTESGKV
ncbi:MAG: radical SAM family RiPP maturation amino acid epimerase [Lachnospiraceae bacterium]|nr:radical SAM family RiPP maturation amino acid epimerase [Lachnospiraceae bacterium]